ncbi:hypothetical protein BRADO1283 [Bradyrhizobium sp. ORS 278]|uniref:hypothetical protein n=1 Tax=Bradyrhizobium sp. (strain ORS 278) TaxID=114615 RepID=UPI0001507DAA|nr:hypothetical protein [Bradyrhizobium sp. ORS 278]CAL75184.1 hypothetical protein BRADO1283 [Bradyrhizobium sp. ORS 278]
MSGSDQSGAGRSWAEIKGEVRDYLGSLRAERAARRRQPAGALAPSPKKSAKPAKPSPSGQGATTVRATPGKPAGGQGDARHLKQLTARSEAALRKIDDLRRARRRHAASSAGAAQAIATAPVKPLRAAAARKPAASRAGAEQARADKPPPPAAKPAAASVTPAAADPKPETATPPRPRPAEIKHGFVRSLASSRDIDELRALGPALKAKLRRLNIRTVGELAAQRPDHLRTLLGPPGRLINLESIVASARSQIK